MIALGIVLLLLGWLIGMGLLTELGVILLVIGIILALLGTTPYAVGGRRWWF